MNFLRLIFNKKLENEIYHASEMSEGEYIEEWSNNSEAVTFEDQRWQTIPKIPMKEVTYECRRT